MSSKLTKSTTILAQLLEQLILYLQTVVKNWALPQLVHL